MNNNLAIKWSDAEQLQAAKALAAIVRYIRDYRPSTIDQLRAQLKVIEEMALGALEL